MHELYGYIGKIQRMGGGFLAGAQTSLAYLLIASDEIRGPAIIENTADPLSGSARSVSCSTDLLKPPLL